jgi:murein DD-endopeptidase MepM/ murein hydrolase activator NlpD
VNGIPEDTAVEAGRELIVPFHGEVFPILRAGARGFLPRFRQHRARLVWPVLGGSISSRFGTRARGSFHEGVDIKAPHGTAVFAAHDGIVAYNGDRLRGYGKLLIVRGDGIATVYGHNSKNLVHEGDEVVAGTPLAAIGATGRATGPHLHFETRVKNEEGEYVAVDPLHFFSLP